jgi:hydrogenase/urease accessory protein HupE
VGVSRGDYAVTGADVDASITLARPELAAAVNGIDGNGDGTIDEAELARGRGAIEAMFLGGVVVVGDGGASCPGSFESAALTEQDGVALHARYRCPAPPSAVRVHVGVVDELPFGHRHIARLTLGGTIEDDVLYRGHEDLSAQAAQAPSKPSASVVTFVRMGVEHILTGYDHLVFLFGLVLVGGRVRSLLGAVTAFTVAHSITLALAALGIWAPSPRIVEPAIALSIVWVGVENFFVESARGRWRITFPFGLVHGFGFAGALREIDLPRPRIPVALVSFNVGVELGQLAVMAVVVPLILVLRKRGWLGARGTRAMSALVVVLGAVWFVLRVFA